MKEGIYLVDIEFYTNCMMTFVIIGFGQAAPVEDPHNESELAFVEFFVGFCYSVLPAVKYQMNTVDLENDR